MRFSLLTLVMLGVVGCTADTDSESPVDAERAANMADEPVASTSARHSPTGAVPAFDQRDGDADAGWQALITENYVSCGLPFNAFTQLLSAADVTPSNQLQRTGPAAKLPYTHNYSQTPAGVELATSNCLACHGTSLFGELVPGLGNEFADFTGDTSAFVERAGALVSDAAETVEWERYADRIAAIAPYSRLGTVGVNPANSITAALIAHHDRETQAWSNTPWFDLPDTDPLPVSVPPWWRMAKKNAMFYLSEGRGDHARIMMAAAMMCVDSVEELEAIDRYAPDVRAFIASLTPPVYPFPINDALATLGEAVFNATCSGCHGYYGDSVTTRPDGSPEYPNLVLPLSVIGTDPTQAELANGEGDALNAWFNDSWYGEMAYAAPALGYVAPPLDGVWATAPFLHNGSVPSIRTLLDSATRPAFWKHVPTHADDPTSYDQANLGWQFESLPAGKAAENDPRRAIRIYDTELTGYGNGGHRFGDHLTAEQRDAVLEYLKTL